MINIEFFNGAICILLIIAITIIFIKTLKNKNPDIQEEMNDALDLTSTSNNIIENFQIEPATKPIYYGNYNDDEIAQRLLKDPEFINKINENYKKAYNESELNEQILNNILILDKAKKTRGELLNIPEKYAKILDNYKTLNDKYKLQKKKIESLMINDLSKKEDLNTFNLKNLKMKKKLQAFTDSIKEIKNIKNRYSDGKILKNIATNTEFTMMKNTNSGNLAQYGITSRFDNEEQPNIYYFAVDGLCLQSNSKNNYEKKDCVGRDMKQFFFIHTIKNNEMYNKYIKLSGNYNNEHLIDILDTSIQYPFYIISPFNIPGYAVLNVDKKIFIKPIRNDPFQRYVEVESSSFCEINNN